MVKPKSEYSIIKGHKILIVCFGGRAPMLGGILPFEFLTFLSTHYGNNCDLLFFIDKKQCWYHKGIDGITSNINTTKIYINNKISTHNYEKVIFMGVSAGAYAAILFGSLCNVSDVIAYIPQTTLKNAHDVQYSDLKNIINANTKYTLYGDLDVYDIHHLHHVSHCDNLGKFKNVTIIRKNGINMKQLRDTGEIVTIIDSIIYQK